MFIFDNTRINVVMKWEVLQAMTDIIRKIIEKAGFMLIANSLLFTPIVASADGNGAVGAVVGAGLGGLITGGVLVSMSKTKHTASRAEKYVEGNLELDGKQDVFERTTTERRKIGS